MYRGKLNSNCGSICSGGGDRPWSPAGRGAEPGVGCDFECLHECCVRAAELPDKGRKVGFTSVIDYSE